VGYGRTVKDGPAFRTLAFVEPLEH